MDILMVTQQEIKEMLYDYIAEPLPELERKRNNFLILRQECEDCGDNLGVQIQNRWLELIENAIYIKHETCLMCP